MMITKLDDGRHYLEQRPEYWGRTSIILHERALLMMMMKMMMMMFRVLAAILIIALSFKSPCKTYVGVFCLDPLIQNRLVPWVARMNETISLVFVEERIKTLLNNSFVAASVSEVSTRVFLIKSVTHYDWHIVTGDLILKYFTTCTLFQIFKFYPHYDILRIMCNFAWWRHQMETFSALLALC